MEQKKEKKYLIGSILCGLLSAFGIVSTVVSLVGGSGDIWIVSDCIQLMLLVMIIYYAFVGYKKPHGNMLKFIILLYAILTLTGMIEGIKIGSTINVILWSVEIGLMCYIAGRLAKLKENIVLMICISIFLVSDFILLALLRSATVGECGYLIIWLDICVAYFLRYKEHREAGLMDAPKK